MSVIGNDPGPYYAKGASACLANIRRDCEKLRCIVWARPSTLQRMAMLETLNSILDDVAYIENRMGVEEPRG